MSHHRTLLEKGLSILYFSFELFIDVIQHLMRPLIIAVRNFNLRFLILPGFFLLQFYNAFSQFNITSFSPQSGPVGSLVTIIGSGFNPTGNDNIVFFGSVKADVITASPNSLTVKVPAGATYHPISITSGFYTTTSTQSFVVTFEGCGQLNANNFSSNTDFFTGNNTVGIANADLDGDGKIDIITVNYQAGTLSILSNQGGLESISFASKFDISIGAGAKLIDLGDFDSDGKPDIIIVNDISRSLNILRNISTPGSILLAQKIEYPTDANLTAIATGDLDKNGKIDIVVTNSTSQKVSIYQNLTNSGPITFSSKIDLSTGLLQPKGIVISDFDQDSKPDIAVTGNGNSKLTLSIFENNSTGSNISFLPKKEYLNESDGSTITAGDLDTDGLTDLVITNTNPVKISIFRNSSTNGLIEFQPKTDLFPGNLLSNVAIADLNGDGLPDLAVSQNFENTISVFKNISKDKIIAFATREAIKTGTFPKSISIGDFDADGKPDLSSLSQVYNTVSIHRNILAPRIFLVDVSKINNQQAEALCYMGVADWANACGDLQTAIDSARKGDHIYVVKGSYSPSRDKNGNKNPIGLREKTFFIKSGVRVYGGFAGNESSLNERSSANNETILDGKIDNENVYNVVSIINADTITLLDGFTIKNGSGTSQNPGGGIHIVSSSPVITNCRIAYNTSTGSGGGIFISGASPSLINCNIYENSAQNGGAISNHNSNFNLINCTIVKNQALIGGGIDNITGATPHITNCIIWGNTDPNGGINNLYSPNGNLLVNSSLIGEPSGVQPGNRNVNVNPLFVDAMNNDFRIIYGSAAVKGGDRKYYPFNAPLTDILGNTRIQNDSISMGAYQGGYSAISNQSGVLYVDSSSREQLGNGNLWSSAYSSLADAVIVAHSNPSIQEIWIAKGSYSPNPFYNSSFVLKKGLKLFGGFAGNEKNFDQRIPSIYHTILNGKIANSIGQVNHIITLSTTDSVVVDGLTITNGFGIDGNYGGGAVRITGAAKIRVSNCKIYNNSGSAIYNYGGNALISNCTFSGNDGQYGGSIYNLLATTTVLNSNFSDNVPKHNNYAFGGAIASLRSTLFIKNCMFRNNRAIHNGGAIYNDQTTAIITNCQFIGNSVGGGNGGAVSNLIGSKVDFTNCVFVKSVGGSGGAVDNHSSETSYINCTITNNRAYYYGGILNRANSISTVTNCIIWGNLSENDRRGDNVFDYNKNKPIGDFNTSYSLVGLQSGIYPGQGNLNENPFFADTSVAMVGLVYNSPAIDAGNGNGYTGNLQTDKDAAGLERLQGIAIDMGAYEYGNTICAGENIQLIAPVTGSLYQWQQDTGNGFFDISDTENIKGTVSRTLQLNKVPFEWNQYKYRCLVNGNASRVYTIVVKNLIASSVSIIESVENICSRNGRSFSAIPINPGSSPDYQWQVNGINEGVNHSTFLSDSLKDSDKVNVILTSNASCNSTPGVQSNIITVTIPAPVTPIVSISTGSTTVCTGVLTEFIASSENAGSNPVYQWRKNGIVVGTNNQRYTDNGLENADMISVQLSSNASCAQPKVVTSNSIVITVKPVPIPTVVINGKTLIEQDEVVVISSSISDAGSVPIYQWQDSTASHSWEDIGGAKNPMINYIPANSGTKIRCAVINQEGCGGPITAFSNVLQFTVNVATAIDPVSSDRYGIRVFPNPATTYLRLDSLTRSDQWLTAEIVTADGQIILGPFSIANLTSVTVATNQLKNGLYIAVLRRKSGAPAFFKFIKL